METEKTYPPEVEAMRQQWLALMAEAANRFMPPDPATATATEVARYDNSPEAGDRRRRQIADAIKPMLDELAKLERHATIKIRLTTDTKNPAPESRAGG